MELISNFGTKNTGEYLRSNVINKAVVSGLLLLKEHMKKMEQNNVHQKEWLVVCSIIFGLVLVVGLVKKSLKGKVVQQPSAVNFSFGTNKF